MKDKKYKVTPGFVAEMTLELRKDTEALKWLRDLEELADVPPARGGYHFSDWERKFIRDLGEQQPVFTDVQRAKLKEIWQNAELRGRAQPEDRAKNLFSGLSPERQAEQRARAARVRLPWEK